MKKIAFLAAIIIALTSTGITTFGQTRPAKRATAPAAKPKVTETPTEVETAPVKKAVVEVSSAQGFFNQGLKCESKDYDCQISNYTKAINLDLKTKDVFKNRGNAYLAKGDIEKGIVDFTKVIELDRNDVSGYKTRGRAFYETAKSIQDLNNALRDFDSAIELEPKDAEAFNYRGLVYYATGNIEKATADFEKVISLSPNNADAFINRGNVFFKLKNFDKAIEDFNRAISLKPDESDAYLSRGIAYSDQNKNDLALKDLTKAIEIDPKRAEIYGSRGEIYEKDKKYDEAIKDFTKAIELKPDTAYTLLRRGMAFRAVKKNDEAISDLTKVIELNPNYAKAYENRGAIYFEIKNYDKAFDDYSKAISLNPNKDNSYLQRAMSHYYKGGDLDDQYAKDLEQFKALAIQSSSRDIELDSQNIEAYIRRGIAYTLLGDYSKAIADYTKAIEINPKSADAFGGRAGNYLATNNLEKAKLDYIKASELNPNDVRIISALALTYSRLNNFNESLNVLTKGIESNPKSGFLYYKRADIYRKQFKNYQKAIIDYQKVIEWHNSDDIFSKGFDILASDVLAKIYHDQKNDTQALLILTKAIEANPTSGEAYWNRGNFYRNYLKDIDKAIADYTKGSEVAPDNDKWKKINIEYVADARKEKLDNANRKKEKREQTAMAILQGVQEVTNVLANSSKTRTSPPVQQTPQANTSGGQNRQTNTGEAEPGTQIEREWGPWITHSGYRGIQTRAKLMYKQKGQSYYYFQLEIKNNYREKITATAFTSDGNKLKSFPISESYSDGSARIISSGGSSIETYLRTANTAEARFYLTIYFDRTSNTQNEDGSRGRIAPYDDGTLPDVCRVYSPPSFSCPNYPRKP